MMENRDRLREPRLIQGMSVSISEISYQQDRLRRFIAPIIPMVMFGVSGITMLSAALYWLGITPASPGVPPVLLVTGLLSGVIALATKSAADQGRLDPAGYWGASFVLVVAGGICLATHVSGQGILYGLPYCMLLAVGASFFWLRRRHFVAGQFAAFVPPLVLLVTMPHTRTEWSFAVQLSAIAILSSTGIYLLTTRINRRIYLLSTELEHRATYDGLTGLLNRASWIHRAEQRLIEDHHLGRHTACLYIDMDRFKQINDELGHSAGDGVLGQVGGVLRQCASSDRIAGRIGGDEFVMLLSGCNGHQAQDVAERVLALLTTVHHAGAGPVASVGIASSTGTDTLDQLLARADMNMLRVKARNRDFHALADGEARPQEQKPSVA